MRRTIWAITLLLVAIGLLAVARRSYVLLRPPRSPGLCPAAALGAGFARHRTLKPVHIVPASLSVCLAPLQFLAGIRRRYIRWHRWSGRVFLVLGGIVGVAALVMSYLPQSGVSVYPTAQGSRSSRMDDPRFLASRCVLLRPGPSSALSSLWANLPLTNFGTAFWLGSTLTLVGTEGWIRQSRGSSGVIATSQQV
jgi:hypothetical protein